ncbi:hypothetical protein AMS68_006270 [Peltaster fructicola]|uniref:Uncharacterized protein n=1 Tax=Peltaster fructicola TaxID=286661 RepID=A0A6H0Y168_9PEZI|nr:hypothetical protein AMS68_006270 [Peltaster fructicola]
MAHQDSHEQKLGSDVSRPAGSDVDTSFFTSNPAEERSTAYESMEPAGPEAVEDPVAEDYISAKPVAQTKSTMLRSQTHDYASNATSLPIKRSDSAPLRQDRSQLRASSTKNKDNPFVQGLKRTVTGGNPAQTRSQYSFVFDPMFSDDSSSGSENDAPAKRKRPGTNGIDDRLSKSDKKLERKHARKGMSYSQFKFGNDHMKTRGKVSRRDGRLNIAVNDTTGKGYVAKALGQTIKHHLDVPKRRHSTAPWRTHAQDHAKPSPDEPYAESIASGLSSYDRRPKLNIVIMVIGSRGDIQPFLKVGKILSQKYGHRVRVATHPAFREFVQKDAGLEFFSVGGDPAQLMAFMVKNPGLIPSVSTFREGEIKRRREQMAEMMHGFWRACINATDDEGDKKNKELLDDAFPFVADAIIANPPSFAHVHIAERLGIPLHMMFTFPYSPTTQFPHPLANIRPDKSNVDLHYVNFMSYALVEMMTWQGLGDLVNDLRTKTLGLEPVSSLWAPGALYRMKVPYTYMWSPSLVPKPADWGPEIDLAGFAFLDLASSFDPPKELSDFLDAGEPPVYIGFGSIVVDDPDKFTQMIFEAVRMAGVRALINKGWGGIGGDGKDVPEGIYMISNVPHDWLFPKVKAVIHHGGAGTTAIGLKCGKPTMIVPFFGDQPFWGSMVAEAKAGAFECIPYKKLSVERFAEGIKQCLTEEAQNNVNKIAESIAKEGDGAENAVKSFHRNLPLAGRYNMRCSILEDRVAVWRLRNSALRLSAVAAEILIKSGKVKWHDLKLIRHYEWNDFDGPGEPITGTTGAMTSSLFGIGEGVGMVPVRIAKHIKKRDEHAKKKQAIADRKAKRTSEKSLQKDATKDDQSQEDSKNGDRPPNERAETTNTLTSTISADPTEPLYQELADDVATGLAKSSYALINLPLNLSLATARGFHNAPRLYGDATVRRPLKITGFKSGFKAAGHELGFGVYDAWTGLVTQPKGGWSDEVTVPAKFAGLGKGVGKGVGGFVLKNISAIIAPPVYVGLGVRKYLEKRIGGVGTSTFLKDSRQLQGKVEERKLGEEKPDGQHRLQTTKDEVLAGWNTFVEIWAAAETIRQGSSVKPVSAFRYERERKQWMENGLLENVRTARAALEARKNGQDLDQFIAKRQEEQDEAEKLPETPVVETSNDDDLKHEPSREAAEAYPETSTASKENLTHNRLAYGRADSDATAVDSSSDEKHDRLKVPGYFDKQHTGSIDQQGARMVAA